MITKTKQGYVVKSESGRNLSRPLPTKAQAENRLKQVEYWKHKK